MELKTTDPGIINFRDKFELKDKVVIITGGMGLIGRAFAEACCQFGASVTIADRTGAGSEEHAKVLSGKFGREMFGMTMDVAKREDVEKLKNSVLEKFGRIDGLINCHQNKTAKFFAKFEEYTDEDWDAVVETNLKGTFLTCQIIGGYMAEKGSGSIINMPSTYSVVAPNHNLYRGTSLGSPAAYSASKGGVMALSQYLATYWAKNGVRVNQITPHGVWNSHEERFEKNFSEMSPLQRMSYNHEVAGAAVYLLSDASSYVTGHNMLIDGGWTAW
ncbi:MAG: SDR family oxidoreductase [Bacteroidetes bacterium]|nr:SDR family oxidoreductase [Bacteroidota bacterium]